EAWTRRPPPDPPTLPSTSTCCRSGRRPTRPQRPSSTPASSTRTGTTSVDGNGRPRRAGPFMSSSENPSPSPKFEGRPRSRTGTMTEELEAIAPFCLRPGEASALLADAAWRRLLVLGDSVAVGHGEPVAGYVDLSWAERLENVLGAV